MYQHSHNGWQLVFHANYLDGRWVATHPGRMSVAGMPLVWFSGASREEVVAQIDKWEADRG